MSHHRCRLCGCTDYSPCTEADGWECCWVEDDLCSACAYRPEDGRVVLLEEQESFSVKES